MIMVVIEANMNVVLALRTQMVDQRINAALFVVLNEPTKIPLGVSPSNFLSRQKFNLQPVQQQQMIRFLWFSSLQGQGFFLCLVRSSISLLGLRFRGNFKGSLSTLTYIVHYRVNFDPSHDDICRIC